MTETTKRKLIIILVSTVMFVCLWVLVALIFAGDLRRSLPGAFVIGFSYGLYEEFYLNGRRGAWLRRLHPIAEILISLLVLVLLLLLVMNLNHILALRYDRISEAYRRLPLILPILFALALLMVMLLRVTSYIGGKNLLALMTGKYRRPVVENKIFMFLDMKDSTELVAKVGALQTRELIGKLFFDISAPITDHGGEIYRFTGDGLVATWPYNSSFNTGDLIDTIDDIVNVVDREENHYRRQFGHLPEFRIGLHCGQIVVCEEGDVKRAIGYYGETIHIAARLEQQAKTMNRDCLLSASLVDGDGPIPPRLQKHGEIHLHGIDHAVSVYTLDFQHAGKTADSVPNRNKPLCSGKGSG